MASRFETVSAITERWEGGWSDHPSDPGGKTKYGITQATLSAYLGRPASAAEIRGLTIGTARQIYRQNYWDRVAGDELPPGIDLLVYDFGVNSGPSRAVKSLQAAVGVDADGWVGPKTLAAIGRKDLTALANTLADRRMSFLRGLPTWKTFGKGWTSRVTDVRKRALAMIAKAPAKPLPNVSEEGTAKATPPAPVEKKLSTEQKVGGVAGGTAIVAGTLGPVAGFWRDNKDILADPLFLGIAAILAAVVVWLVFFRKPKSVEAAA